MIVKMSPDSSKDQAEAVRAELQRLGFEPRGVHMPFGDFIVGVGEEDAAPDPLMALPGVTWAKKSSDRTLLASSSLFEGPTVVRMGATAVGGETLAIIAGPCSVEDPEQIASCARFVAAYGGTALRGGAFKPRTSPYSFQGKGLQGLSLLKRAGEAAGLPIVTEVMEPADVAPMAPYVDCFQIGARSMQNFPLLREVGKAGKPVLLKRGPSAAIKELLMAAEYILVEGNPNVILCERGIKTFETATRNTLDLNAVPVLKSQTHLPVVVDPSHGTGRRDAVIPMARAAVAAGADGLLVEVHPDPDHALSDGDQSLTLAQFRKLVEEVRPVAKAVGRRVAAPASAMVAQGEARTSRRSTGWGS